MLYSKTTGEVYIYVCVCVFLCVCPFAGSRATVISRAIFGASGPLSAGPYAASISLPDSYYPPIHRYRSPTHTAKHISPPHHEECATGPQLRHQVQRLSRDDAL